MRKKLIPLLAVALAVAGVATVLLYGLIADRFGAPPPRTSSGSTGMLVVAARSIDRGKIIDADDLRQVDHRCPQPGACFQASNGLIGRTALEPVLSGQPVLARLVSAAEAAAAPSASIPLGYRVVTLHPADSSGVISLLRSGDRVDLQAIDADQPGVAARLSVHKVWTNVEVLQVLPPDPASTWTQRPVVTVLLPPSDADLVSLKDTTGRIRLILRNREESSGRPAVTPVLSSIPNEEPPPLPPPAKATAPISTAPVVVQAASAPSPPPAVVPPAVASKFRVRLISINPESLGELGADANTMQPRIEARPLAALEETLTRLERDRSAHVLAEKPLLTTATPSELLLDPLGGSRPGPHAIRLRMRTTSPGHVKVEPEARVLRPQGAAARRAEQDLALAPGQALLVSSLLEHREGQPVLPGEGGAREPRLVLVITPAP